MEHRPISSSKMLAIQVTATAIFLFAFVVGLSARAEEGRSDLLATETEPFFADNSVRLQNFQQSTTDGYQHTATMIEYAGRIPIHALLREKWDLGFASEYHTGRTNIGNFTANRTFARVGRQVWRKVRLDAWAGAAQLRQQTENSGQSDGSKVQSTLPIGNLSSVLNYGNDSKIQIDYGQDFVFQYWVNQVSVDQALHQRGTTVSIEDRSLSRFRIINASGFQQISDGNRSNAHENSVLFQVKQNKWIWLGWGSRWIERFQFLHGPRLEYAFELSSQTTLRGYLAASESRDIGHSAMFGHYQQMSLEYRLKKFTMMAEYTGLGDFPHSSNWSRSDWRMNIAGNF